MDTEIQKKMNIVCCCVWILFVGINSGCVYAVLKTNTEQQHGNYVLFVTYIYIYVYIFIYIYMLNQKTRTKGGVGLGEERNQQDKTPTQSLGAPKAKHLTP